MNASDFERKGSDHHSAFAILAERFTVPPSLEVFDHELTLARRGRPGLTPDRFARSLALSYNPIAGLGRETP